jgi:hypothetical protein
MAVVSTKWIDRTGCVVNTVVFFMVDSGFRREKECGCRLCCRFAQDNGLMFLETSALTGENVEEAFIMAARTILGRIDEGMVAGMAHVWMTILSRHVKFVVCHLVH